MITFFSEIIFTKLMWRRPKCLKTVPCVVYSGSQPAPTSGVRASPALMRCRSRRSHTRSNLSKKQQLTTQTRKYLVLEPFLMLQKGYWKQFISTHLLVSNSDRILFNLPNIRNYNFNRKFRLRYWDLEYRVFFSRTGKNPSYVIK